MEGRKEKSKNEQENEICDDPRGFVTFPGL